MMGVPHGVSMPISCPEYPLASFEQLEGAGARVTGLAA